MNQHRKEGFSKNNFNNSDAGSSDEQNGAGGQASANANLYDYLSENLQVNRNNSPREHCKSNASVGYVYATGTDRRRHVCRGTFAGMPASRQCQGRACLGD